MDNIRIVNITDTDFSKFINNYNFKLFKDLEKLFIREKLGYIHHELIISVNYSCYKATKIFNNSEEIIISLEFHKNCTFEELNKDICYLWLNYLAFTKFN